MLADLLSVSLFEVHHLFKGGIEIVISFVLGILTVFTLFFMLVQYLYVVLPLSILLQPVWIDELKI